MSEEINYFVCGYCVWTHMQEAPPDKGEKYPKKRGYCRFEPPSVFLVPVPSTQKIAALGQQPGIQMAPMMQRPVVEENEPMCGRYSPNPEAAKGLGLKEAKCGCSPPGEECDGCK